MQISIIGFWGAYPAANSATSSYLLEEEGFKLLIDCGSGCLSRLQQRTDVQELNAVLLSHYHKDHVADIGVLQYAWLVQNSIHDTKQVLPIYGHREDKAAFKELSHQYTKGVEYDPEQTMEIGPFTINFLQTKHPVPCYAMKICNGTETIVYTADTSYFSGLAEFARGADLLITDTNFYKGMDGSKPGHMTSEEAALIARDAEVETLWLSHLPHFGNLNLLKQEAADVFKGNIELASEELTWRGRT
ncbi:MBL fold metallo-hydrolase [Halobacillus campisalis]|uniref:MBL fold metallo-hydrolase n=1 Tax=Halobacillus campisalis TaxID=435909 RepID=A0ABW2K4U9_9BACI|nr:MBL fold metallo-hydrolase [Halobacillus campisalis]